MADETSASFEMRPVDKLPEPYYEDGTVTLYHGDCREMIDWPMASVIVTDPPYGETNLAWDRWPDGWPTLVADRMPSLTQMWCFGSTRMFLDHRDEFAAWHLAQDIVWSKPRGRGITTDRFSRSHELVLHWYRGRWSDLHHDTPRVPSTAPVVRRTRRGSADDGSKVKPVAGGGEYIDNRTRLMLTVIPGDPGDARTTFHPTQKPMAVLEPIIHYSCPPDGVVFDPFAGSGSTLVAAKRLGRRAVGVEADERYCELAARRCAQGVLAL